MLTLHRPSNVDAATSFQQLVDAITDGYVDGCDVLDGWHQREMPVRDTPRSAVAVALRFR
jgi:hypothetical protein